MLEIICSPIKNKETLIDLLTIIVRAVSVTESLHIKLVTQLGFIPQLLDILKANDDDISREVVLILINLAACDSNCAELITNMDGHKKLIELIDSSNTILVERCLWVLGNIAGDKASLREVLLETELPLKLSNVLAREIPLSLRRIACWVASHLCHGNLNASRVKPMIEPLNKCLYQTDLQVRSETLWAISKIIQDKFIRTEVASNVSVAKILELMLSESADISIPATYIIGCICAGDYTCTSLVVENGGMKYICSLFKNPSVNYFITKYTCWTIANLSLNSLSHLNLLLDYDILKRADEIIAFSPEHSVFFLNPLVTN